MTDKPILVCVAWPYANGSLHLGHVAGSLLPPDIFARYHRAAGDRVLMVSGSDCHGTPITVTAEKMGITPAQVVEKYHAEHKDSLKRLGIAFDLFTKTSTDNHRELVQQVFLAHKEMGYLKEETTQGMYCPKESKFLPDRYVEGTCPHCGNEQARGDQCDKCGKTLDPADLKAPRCKTCGATPEARPTTHFFFRLPLFTARLREWTKGKTHWRANTINFTENWLKEGLKDRAITRDLTWGVPIPINGYEDKRIYVWYEAVCGYYTASVEWARASGRPEAWKEWWLNPEARSYYFLGKDNIPFHTIIWPAMLMGYSDFLVKKGQTPRALDLPYDVPANEFLTLSGQQFSKSRGIGITLPDILSRFDPDTIRYYLSANMPEQKDADWSWADFMAKVNDELVGTFGNLAHRVLSFTADHFSAVPARGDLTPADEAALERIHKAREAATAALEACEFKRALREAMALAQFANQYVNDQAPWKVVKEDKQRCATILHVCLQMIKALAVMLQPFLPFGTQRLWRMLGEEGEVAKAHWHDGTKPLRVGARLSKPEILYRKIEPEQVGEGKVSTTAGASAQVGTTTGASTKVGTTSAGAAQVSTTAGTPAKVSTTPGGATKVSTTASATDARSANPATKGLVTFDEFQRLDLRIGEVLSVEPHPNADKLYVLKVDVGGETRQLVAGMRAHYKPEELLGKQVALIVNLAPSKIRGVESQGMLFGADDGAVVSVLRPDKPIKTGAKIR